MCQGTLPYSFDHHSFLGQYRKVALSKGSNMAEPVLTVVMFAVTGAGALYYYLRYRSKDPPTEHQKPALPSSPFRAGPQHPLTLRCMIAHESGHAITTWYSRHVVRITEIKISRYRGYVDHVHTGSQAPDALYDLVITALAGMAAEIIVIGKIGSSFESRGDLRRAKQFASTLLMESHRATVLKMLEKYSESDFKLDIAEMFKDDISSEIRIILNSAYIDSKKRILLHRAGFDRLQNKLFEQRILNTEDIAKLFGPRIWAPK